MTAKRISPKTRNDVWDRKPVLWTVLGTCLGLVLLYVSTRKVDGETLLATLQSADLRWAFALVVVIVGFTLLKAWRWKLLLRPIVDVRFGSLHSAIYVGLAVNYLIAHVGEFLRATVIARGSRVSNSAVFATVVVERALDFLAFLIVITALYMFASDLPEYVATAGVITGGIVVIAIVGLYSFLHPPDWLVRLLEAISRPLTVDMRTWCARQIRLFRRGLVALRDIRIMIAVFVISVLQWLLIVAAIWVSTLAVGESVSIVALVATFVLILVGLTLPNSPMQIGTTQLAFTIGLSTGGIMATSAIAASLVYTMFLIIPVMVIGGMCLLRNRI